MSTAARVKDLVAQLEPGAFVHARDLPGSRASVESAVSRLASDGELVRVRKGLYFRPHEEGSAAPDPLAVGLAIAGPGSGPARTSAARLFGLTTQVPAIVVVAVAGRAPSDRAHIRFVTRPSRRREVGLTPYEVALLELLRDYDSVAERPLKTLAVTLAGAISDGSVRPELIRRTVAAEWHVAARRRLTAVEVLLDEVTPA